ncbi:gliding motility-associated C-terminal domain-containing protein [Cytophagaceae bacterium ABcell3]|nr:gliding motility-associated C-terminal domain-containing protein [Cytophagaceae bacterium ABcell3]
MVNYKLIMTSFLLFFGMNVFAEGTKEMRPEKEHYGAPILINHHQYTTFGQYGAPDEQQIKVKVGATDEVVYFGFNNRRKEGGFLEIPYRWVSPSGIVVVEGIMQDEGQGCINTWEEAVAGPKRFSEQGYDALYFEPEETGNYVLEFDLSDKPEEEAYLYLFDISVANADGQIVPGRLHCKEWQLTTESQENEYFGKVYPYTENGVVYEVDLNRIQPFTFAFFVNSKGTTDSGDFFEDRKSRMGKHLLPEYDVFLNPPDEKLFPTQQFNFKYQSKINKQSCPGSDFCIEYESDISGHVEGFIDLNQNGVFDSDTDFYFFKEVKGGGAGCIEWDGLDLSGRPLADQEFQVFSDFRHGLTNFLLYDVEHNKHGIKVQMIRPEGVKKPLLYWDDSLIEDGQTVDGDPLVNTDGCKSNELGCHRWENRGGLEGPRVNQETINTWWYAGTFYDTVTLDFSEAYAVIDQSWEKNVAPSYHIEEHGCNEASSVIIQPDNEEVRSFQFTLKRRNSNDLFTSSDNIVDVSEGVYDLIITDNASCEVNLRNYISVPRPSNCDQAFSPNGDGISDTYYISTPGIAKIYNKQGVLVKELQTPTEWDGTDNMGSIVRSGLYAIIINGNTVSHVSVIK